MSVICVRKRSGFDNISLFVEVGSGIVAGITVVSDGNIGGGCLAPRDGLRISSWGLDRSGKKKISNTHSYSINKLSTKANTQKSLFLNILRYNHLPTKKKKKTRNTIIS